MQARGEPPGIGGFLFLRYIRGVRPFFLVWLVAWTLGIAAGVAGVSGKRAAVVAWLVVLAAWTLSRRVVGGAGAAPLAAGVLALGWLGFVWAGAHAPNARVETCGVDDAVVARVVSPVDERVQQVRFFAAAEDGCRWQVFADRFSTVREGDRVALAGGRVRELPELWAEAAGYARYLERQGAAGSWQFPDVEMVEAGGWRRPALLASLNSRVRTLFVEPDASLVLAMLLAERGTLPEALVEHFRATGVSHILAISGLHISLIAGLLVGLVLMVPIGPVARTLLVLAALWAYITVIGAPASAVRAAAFWTVALSALRLRLLVSLPAVMLLAGGVMATVNPPYMTDIGWQLSISAVAGIFFSLWLASPWLARTKTPWRASLSVVLVSLGASLATAPLIAYHFGNVATLSVAANLVVVPLVPIFLVLALTALGLSFLSYPLAMLVAYVLHVVVVWFEVATNLLASLPGAYMEGVSVPLWFLPAYYTGLAAIAAVVLHWQRRSWLEVWAP